MAQRAEREAKDEHDLERGQERLQVAAGADAEAVEQGEGDDERVKGDWGRGYEDNGNDGDDDGNGGSVRGNMDSIAICIL